MHGLEWSWIMERLGRGSEFEAAIVPVHGHSRSRHSRSEKKRESFPYNPLLDKGNNSYFSNPEVMHHLIKQGFVANVGPKKNNSAILLKLIPWDNACVSKNHHINSPLCASGWQHYPNQRR